MYSSVPISGLVRPSRASLAICFSWGVSSSRVSSRRLRTFSPVASSSRRAPSEIVQAPRSPHGADARPIHRPRGARSRAPPFPWPRSCRWSPSACTADQGIAVRPLPARSAQPPPPARTTSTMRSRSRLARPGVPRRGTATRPRPRAHQLRVVLLLHRPRRQHVASPGGHDAAPRPGLTPLTRHPHPRRTWRSRKKHTTWVA